jgi:DivIVA domain-containing protein
MATLFLVLVVVLVLAALVFGVITMLSGDDPGLFPVEPDGQARPLPNTRSLSEIDLKEVRFDLGLRGYRMSQVDRVLRRTAYDLGYKDEMIAVLEAEVMALRDGRVEDAELLRKARESAANPSLTAPLGTDATDSAESAEDALADAAPSDISDDVPEDVTEIPDVPDDVSENEEPAATEDDAERPAHA